METLLKLISNFRLSSIVLILVLSGFYSCEKPSSTTQRVWCTTHNRWEDRETNNAEQQRPEWCSNCKTFHAPGADEE